MNTLRNYVRLILSERIRAKDPSSSSSRKATFNMNDFKKLKQNDPLEGTFLKYAKRNLQRLGEGSSREVFLLSSQKVLKVAVNEKGIAQNEAEIDVYTNPKTRPIISKVYDYGSGYEWLVSELVRELTYEKICTLLDLDGSWDYMIKELIVDKMPIDKLVKRYTEKNLRVKDSGTDVPGSVVVDKHGNHVAGPFFSPPGWEHDRGTPEAFKAIDEINVQNPKLKQFLIALKQTMEVNELERGDIQPQHFGKSASGDIVLLDYGYTTTVLKNHYGGGDISWDDGDDDVDPSNSISGRETTRSPAAS